MNMRRRPGRSMSAPGGRKTYYLTSQEIEERRKETGDRAREAQRRHVRPIFYLLLCRVQGDPAYAPLLLVRLSRSRAAEEQTGAVRQHEVAADRLLGPVL